VRRLLLTLGGIYLVWFIAPRLLVLMIPFWGMVFMLQRLLAWKEQAGGVGFFLRFLAFISMLAPMVLWKIGGAAFNTRFNLMTDGLIKMLSYHVWQIDATFQLITPVGLSFVTFRALDLLIKTSIGTLPALRFDQVMFYGFFPPVQVVGPIIEYREIERQEARIAPDDILAGALRIAVGAVKIFFIAEALKPTLLIFDTPRDFSVWQLWIKFVLFTFYFYIDFSGYSDMAIGASRVFGFRIRENFDFPFFKRNIREFWNSWHMSLSSWAQRNVFVPAGGYRAKTQYPALFLTIMAIALWHGTTLPIIGFGIYHFMLLFVHRLYSNFAQTKGIADTPNLISFYTALTYISVLVSFPLITTTWDKAWPFYRALLGM
jgi:alginate O-acetyltransferase complex protein AlgI